MKLSSRQKLGLGSPLTVIGAIGIVVGPVAGWSDFDRPWSFLMGFGFGVSAGLGVALCVSGLIDRRSEQ